MAANNNLNISLTNAQSATISGTGTSGSVLGSNGNTVPTWTNGASVQWASSPSFVFSDSLSTSTSDAGKIHLKGENADIDINGVSLKETLQGIQDRLGMLRPNTELEQEWDQLLELGKQYRELEAQLKEKSQMWKTLKKKE